MKLRRTQNTTTTQNLEQKLYPTLGPCTGVMEPTQMTEKEMSEILNLRYDSVFTEPLNTLQINYPNILHSSIIQIFFFISDVTIIPSEFEVAIGSMPMHSAPRPDS